MAWIEGVRGVLLDVDGTLLDGDRAIPGSAELLLRLRGRKIPFRLVTNTTRRPRRAVESALQNAGLAVSEDEILAPSALARRRILESGLPRAALLIPEASREDFEDVVEDEDRPAWVVVGDLGKGFTWERLNRAFLWLQAGARLLALQKNRCWQAGAEGGLQLDAGPFVAALEYAADVRAEVIGKPSPDFFHLAVKELALRPDQALMVGDDVENDGMGGVAAGCRAALVRTGKFTEQALVRSGLEPDLVLDSVAELFR